MTDWNEGYVTNTEYTSHFYPFLSPVSQNLALLLAGFVPTDLGGDFTYCELGCGQGYTTALLAAANPQGRFWGVDFNPVHIAGATRIAAAAKLSNIAFLEKSFAEIGDADLPAFDFIALHGVWSWISAANRAAITAFIYAKLKPGGVLYISYNALPGWATAAPLRQLLVESQRHKSEIDIAAVDSAIATARRMKEIDMGYFKANPSAGADLEGIAKLSKNYVLHEYFNRDWTPFYFSQVASELKPAKLAFACSSDIIEHVDQLCIGKAAEALLKDMSDTTVRQTIRDFFRNRRFRRDLFTRGGRRLTANERQERLRSTRLALVTQPVSFPLEANFPAGRITLRAEPFNTVMTLLAGQPMTLANLLEDPSLASANEQNVYQSILILAAAGRVQAALPPEGEDARRESTARFNQAMSTEPVGREAQALASPVLGAGVQFPATDQAIWTLERSGQEVTAERLLKLTGARSLKPQTSEGPVTPEDEAKTVAEILAAYHARRLPLYSRLGVV